MRAIDRRDPSVTKEQQIMDLTSYMMHMHYCENNIEALVSLFDEQFSWFGAGEEEHAVGTETVTQIFRQFAGKVPRCNITDEHYYVLRISPDAYLCTGLMWISTDPSTNVYLRVHQRVTMGFRWVDDRARCFHIHISNPYSEMVEGDVGFPTQMAQQTTKYLQEQVALQKHQIEEKTAELTSIYNTVPCGILRLLRKPDGSYQLLTFNRTVTDMLEWTENEVRQADWSRGYAPSVVVEDDVGMQECLSRLRKPGDSLNIDYRIRNRSGRLVYLNCSNAMISDSEQGQVIQRIFFDITRRKELESALKRLSYEDTLTGMYNRNRFNQDMEYYRTHACTQLGVACFDLNGLKELNDRQGHTAGDQLISRAAAHILQAFRGRSYRVGGDEFVVIDEESSEASFRACATAARESMQMSGISISAGVSWRMMDCNLREQLEEADRLMYEEKARHYSQSQNDRRKNRT